MVAAMTALATACFLVPAWSNIMMMVNNKVNQGSLSLMTIGNVMQLQAGTSQGTLVVLFWLGVLAGFITLAKRQARFNIFSLTLIICHLLSLLIFSPYKFHVPLIANRYLLLLLPFVLIWLAVGLSIPWWPAQKKSGKMVQQVIAYVFVLLLALTGPLGDTGFRSSSFTHHNDLVQFSLPRATMDRADIPDFYRRLSGQGGENPVLEFPWHDVWRHSRTPYIYQDVHGQEVLVASPWPWYQDKRMDMKNVIKPDPKSFLNSRARYLVVHLDLKSEEKRVLSSPVRFSERADQGNTQFLQKSWELLQKSGTNMAQRLYDEWGSPLFSDATIAVWDLDRIRKP
jgi:hypothetical protein